MRNQVELVPSFAQVARRVSRVGAHEKAADRQSDRAVVAAGLQCELDVAGWGISLGWTRTGDEQQPGQCPRPRYHRRLVPSHHRSSRPSPNRGRNREPIDSPLLSAAASFANEQPLPPSLPIELNGFGGSSTL